MSTKDNFKPITMVDDSVEIFQFDTGVEFKGRPTDIEHIPTGEDGKPKKDSNGRDMNFGYIWEEDKTEKKYSIGHYHSIDKFINMEIPGIGKTVIEQKAMCSITCIGKMEHNGKPFRQFVCTVLAL